MRRDLRRESRWLAINLLEMALEAALSLPSVQKARAWWKLEVVMMSEEEQAAKHALIAADIPPRHDWIDDAKEAAGIALIQSGKEAVPWNGI